LLSIKDQQLILFNLPVNTQLTASVIDRDQAVG